MKRVWSVCLVLTVVARSACAEEPEAGQAAVPVKLSTRSAYHSSPSFSPDGMKVAYSAYENGVQKIWTAGVRRDAELGLLVLEEPAQLTTGTASDDDPAWSPGGDRIAFSSNREGPWQVFVMDADGSAPELAVKQVKQEGTKPAWSPDGKSIALASNLNIGIAPVGGRDIRFITQSGYNDFPSWSPDGSRIMFSSGNDLKISNADGSDQKPLTKSGWNGDPAWSPVDDRIAFVSNRGGTYDLWVMSLNGREAVRLTNDVPRESGPAWSPDGEWILYCSDRLGGQDMWAVRAPRLAEVGPEAGPAVEEPAPEEAEAVELDEAGPAG